MYFDVNVLDADRQRITDKLLRNGYYKFNKDYIGYTADTVRNTYNVDLTQHLHPFKTHVSDSAKAHQQYWINKINFITDLLHVTLVGVGVICVDDAGRI